MEGVITLMKVQDRKLTDHHLALAVDKNLDLVQSNNLWKVSPECREYLTYQLASVTLHCVICIGFLHHNCLSLFML